MNHTAFGELIRRRRERQGLDLRALAARAKLSERTVWDIEHGNPDNRKRRPETYHRLLTVLGLPRDESLAVLEAGGESMTLVEAILTDFPIGHVERVGEVASLTPTVSVDYFLNEFGMRGRAAEKLKARVEGFGGLLLSP